MFGNLSPEAIDKMLKENNFGRLGCCQNNHVYVVPINYAYNGSEIYAISPEGKKLDMMRNNPNVCFEVDIIKNVSNWQSIIIQGTFFELKSKEEREEGFKVIFKESLALVSSAVTHLYPTWPFLEEDVSKVNGILFKIVPSEKSGRFENSADAPLLFN
jgi:uncharacterized protein